MLIDHQVQPKEIRREDRQKKSQKLLSYQRDASTHLLVSERGLPLTGGS